MTEIIIRSQQDALDYVRENKQAISAALNDNVAARSLSLMKYMASRNRQRYEPSVWQAAINRFETTRTKEESV